MSKIYSFEVLVGDDEGVRKCVPFEQPARTEKVAKVLVKQRAERAGFSVRCLACISERPGV